MSKFDLSGEDFGMGRKRVSSTAVQQGNTSTNRGSLARPEGKTSSDGQKRPNERVSVSVNKDIAPKAKAPQNGSQGPRMQITSIRFTPENHYYVRQEASMRGISVIDFVNRVIDEYRSKPGNVHTSGVYKTEDKW